MLKIQSQRATSLQTHEAGHSSFLPLFQETFMGIQEDREDIKFGGVIDRRPH